MAVRGTTASYSVVFQLCPPLAEGNTAAPVIAVLVELVVVTVV